MPDIKIPEKYICPITTDIYTAPYRVNCQGSNPFSNFKGHVFDGPALAAWSRKNKHLYCPECNGKFTKATPDKKLAKKITKKFTDLSPDHKKLFEDAQTEVRDIYGNMIGQPIISEESGSSSPPRRTSDGSFRDVNLFSRLFYQPSILNPLGASDSTKYNNISRHIGNDLIVEAENEADGIVNTYYRDKSYEAIAEESLYKYLSRNNITRSPASLQNAIRVSGKITDIQRKDDLYFKIVRDSAAFQYRHYRHIALLEGAAVLITHSHSKNRALNAIAERYISNYSNTSDETQIQNAIRIANNVITQLSYKDNILEKATDVYIENFKLKKAQNLNDSNFTNYIKNRNNEKIAKKYILRGFNTTNFQKALNVTSKMTDMYLRNSTYTFLAQEASSNGEFSKSIKTISKISNRRFRFGLYLKISGKLLVVRLFKLISTPFRLTFLGIYSLLNRLESFIKRR